MNKDIAIKIKNLTKVYQQKANSIKALDDVSFNIKQGTIFGLLGPNGAGKSTLINILAGLVIKTAGEVNIWGIDIDNDPRNARAPLGVVSQEINLDPFFSPRNLLEIQSGLYGVPKSQRNTTEVLKQLGLLEKADSYSRTLSGGMKRRVMVAKAMVHNPPILVLDEPTAGVDVELRRSLWKYVKELNANGTTIVLTTHYLEEAEQLCDDIAIIDKGKLIVLEEKRNIMNILDSKSLRIILAKPASNLPKAVKKFKPSLDKLNPNLLTVEYQPSKLTAGEIIRTFAREGLEIIDLETRETNLEDIFLTLTDNL